MNLRKTAFLVALMSSVSANTFWGAEAQSPIQHDGKGAMSYQVSGPFSFGNLSLFLIRGADKLKDKQYITLPEAIAQKAVTVSETGDVNALKINNLSNAVVFIQSGEIVKGGQQDRALQSDMLIPPHSKDVSLPCFCVEHGRWTGRVGESSYKFDSASNFVVGNGMQRAIKRDADQSKVWQEVAMKQQQLSRSVGQPVASPVSPTSLQLTLEQKNVQEASQAQYKALADVVNKEKDAIGYAVAINGKISNADIYASGALFRKLWPGLLKSAVTEAVSQKGQASVKPPSGSEVKSVLAQAEKFKRDPSAPYRSSQLSLQGATNGAIGPQGQDATVVTGVNTAGTVRNASPSPSPLDYFFRTSDRKSGVVIHENFLGK